MKWSLKRDILALAAIVLAAGLAVVFYPSLPDQVPTHFGWNGTPDAFSSKGMFVALELGLLAGVYLFLTFIPFADPFRPNIGKRYDVLLVFRDIVVVFLLFTFLATIMASRAGEFRGDYVAIGVGLLFAVLGNYLPKLPRNFFFGIRVPWTLASETVWRRTHIVGGWLFVAGGLLMAALALTGVSVRFLFLAILLPVFVISSLVYPYLLFRKLQKSGETPGGNL